MWRGFLISIVASLGLLGSAAPVQARATQSSTAPPAPTAEIRRPDLHADFFAASPALAVRGAVIVLGGSEGGLARPRNLARRLAAEGVSALAVSYFGEPGQATRLDLIPIESVTRAREWLQARESFQGSVAVLGISKGAELALLAASRDPGLAAVVAAVPSDVVWQGIDRTGSPTGSSWTSGGEPQPYVPYDMSRAFTGLLDLYQRSLTVAPVDSAARIPVERINGPILLISGDSDTMWPSWEMANRIEARLKAGGFAHNVTNLVYPGTGHAVFGPPIADPTAPGLRNALFVGGTIEGLVAARADVWPRTIDFLKRALAD